MNVLRAFDTAPLLLSVVPAARFPPWLKMDNRTHDRDRVEAARSRLQKIARTVGNDAECRVVIGDPAEQIAACATDTGAGLIVLTLKRAVEPASDRDKDRSPTASSRVRWRRSWPFLSGRGHDAPTILQYGLAVALGRARRGALAGLCGVVAADGPRPSSRTRRSLATDSR